MRLKACTITPGLYIARNETSGFVHARQAFSPRHGFLNIFCPALYPNAYKMSNICKLSLQRLKNITSFCSMLF